MFLLIWHFGRQSSQLLVWYEPHVVRCHVKGLLQIKIVDLIPDAFLIACDNDLFDPMGCAVIGTVAVICIHKRSLLSIADRNADLSQLSFFGDIENRLLIVGFHRLNATGEHISALHLVPQAVVWVSIGCLPILYEREDVYHLVRSEKMKLIRF